jgi:hypothetical protein
MIVFLGIAFQSGAAWTAPDIASIAKAMATVTGLNVRILFSCQ